MFICFYEQRGLGSKVGTCPQPPLLCISTSKPVFFTLFIRLKSSFWVFKYLFPSQKEKVHILTEIGHFSKKFIAELRKNHIFCISQPAFGCQLAFKSGTVMLVDLLFVFVMDNNVERSKQTILISERCAKHPFAGQNTQHNSYSILKLAF